MINIKNDRYVSARQRASSSVKYEFFVFKIIKLSSNISTDLMISIYWISLASSRFLYSQTFQRFQSLSLTFRISFDDNLSLQEKLIDETTKYEMLSSQISLELTHSWNIHATRLHLMISFRYYQLAEKFNISSNAVSFKLFCELESLALFFVVFFINELICHRKTFSVFFD